VTARILDWFAKGDPIRVEGQLFFPEWPDGDKAPARQLRVTVENKGVASVGLNDVSVADREGKDAVIPLWIQPSGAELPFILQAAQVWTGTTPLEELLNMLKRTGPERAAWRLTVTAHDDSGLEHRTRFDLNPLF